MSFAGLKVISFESRRAAEMAPREPWRMVLQMAEDFECLAAGLASDGQEAGIR